MYSETARLSTLEQLDIDRNPETVFDDITRLAATICDTPISLITMIEQNVQWTKSRYGLSLLETSRDNSFCSHAIMSPFELMEVKNTLEDERFRNNPLVLEDPKMRFYAGMPIVTSDGYPLGAVCVIDGEPRKLSMDQRASLGTLSKIAMQLIYARAVKRKLGKMDCQFDDEFKKLLNNLP